MDYPANVPLQLRRGTSLAYVLRWGVGPVVYKTITGITQAAPVNITVTGHAVPDGWPVAITDVIGMREINAEHNPPWPADFVRATVIGPNNVSINSIDAKSYNAYESAGVLRYATPVVLTGYTGRWRVWSRPGAPTALLDRTTADGGVVINLVEFTITLTLTGEEVDLLSFSRGVHQLDMITGTTSVPVIAGPITVAPRGRSNTSCC